MLVVIAIVIIAAVSLLNVAGLLLKVFVNEKRGIKTFFMPGAMLLVLAYHRVNEYFFPMKDKESLRYFDQVYVGENPEETRLKKESELVGLLLIIMFGTACLYLVLVVSQTVKTKKLEVLKRPESGSSEETLVAEYDGREYALDIELNQAVPTAEEQANFVSQVEDELEEYILGDNKSLEEITSDLRLDEGVFSDALTIYWTSSDAEIVATDGTVSNDQIEDSVEIELVASITYFDTKSEESFDLVVLPESEETQVKTMLENRLKEMLSVDETVEKITLPLKINGKEIAYYNYSEDNSSYVFWLGIFAAFLMLPYGVSLRRTKLLKRRGQLICDYPDVVSKMTILLESGMSIRMAMERIASDYERRKEAGRRKGEAYAYEEILRTRNELALGVSEQEAYENFGRRCGNIYYIRFASLLIQNLRKGNESLLLSLQQEVTEARRERQAEIRKNGEAVGVKLLLPMAGMLVIVMALILVPAFMSM